MLTLSQSVLAKNYNASKPLTIPFINQAINSTDYEGLSVSYDMNLKPLQKVFCVLADLYKGYIEYTDNHSPRESHTYGKIQTIIFTSMGKDEEVTENLDQFHADAKGTLLINEVDRKNNAYASCFYIPEEKQKF